MVNSGNVQSYCVCWTCHVVNKSGVWLPNKEPSLVERKICLILDTGNQGMGELGGHLSKAWLSPNPDSQGTRTFIDGGRGSHVDAAQSALEVTLKFIFNGLTSVILIVLHTVNLQFQGWFVPISLRPVLRIVVVQGMATGWSSCS